MKVQNKASKILLAGILVCVASMANAAAAGRDEDLGLSYRAYRAVRSVAREAYDRVYPPSLIDLARREAGDQIEVARIRIRNELPVAAAPFVNALGEQFLRLFR